MTSFPVETAQGMTPDYPPIDGEAVQAGSDVVQTRGDSPTRPSSEEAVQAVRLSMYIATSFSLEEEEEEEEETPPYPRASTASTASPSVSPSVKVLTSISRRSTACTASGGS